MCVPQDPMQVPPQYVEQTKCKDIPTPSDRFPEPRVADDDCASPSGNVESRQHGRCSSGAAKRRILCGMVAALDDTIGGIRDELVRCGMWSNTLLIVHGDNGGASADAASNHPFRGFKGVHTPTSSSVAVRLRLLVCGAAVSRAIVPL